MSRNKFQVKNLSADDLKMVLGASSGASQALVHRQMEEVATQGRRDPIARAEKMLPRQPLATTPGGGRDDEDGQAQPVSLYVRAQDQVPVRTARPASAKAAPVSAEESRADTIEQLERLVDLRLRNLITDDEFRAMKRRLTK